MPVLTSIDILGIQQYVFASNRLRDVVSASWLVHWATSRDGALQKQADRVLMAGGGNAFLLFDDEKQARDFAANYTRLLYDEAPGLEALISHRSFEQGGLASAIKDLQKDLAVAKLERTPSVPQLGISVTAACQITGLPASGFDPREPRVHLSRMVLQWRNDVTRKDAEKRWESFLSNKESHEVKWAFPREIDKMGRSQGERSLVGVVHVDGNSVGQAIQEWLDKCVENELSDHEVRDQLGQWTQAIDKAGEEALERIVRRTIDAIKYDDKGAPCMDGLIPELSFNPSQENHTTLLPLRPVLLGGDDLTFLCDGRIALDLAEVVLATFEREIPHLGKLSACAGVAIVHSHFPFERAYAFAEELCNSAKQKRRNEDSEASWLDWHIGSPLPGQRIGELRRRKYKSSAWEFTCRPYRLGEGAQDIGSWRWLSRTVLGTGENGFRGERWTLHRNKLKGLIERIRYGPDEIKRVRGSWTVAGLLPWPHGLREDGSLNGRTPLLDALELLDIHLPLDGGRNQ